MPITRQMSASVCIVVPLNGALSDAEQCLTSLAALASEPAFEVVIVGDGAPWLTPLLQSLGGDVHVLVRDRPQGPGRALAAALELTEAPIVVLMNGALIAEPDCVAALCTALADPQVGTAFSAAGTAGAASALTASCAAWRTADARAARAYLETDDAPTAALALALAERGLRTRAVSDSVVHAPAPAPMGAPHGTALELTIVIPTLDATSPRLLRCLSAVRLATDIPHQVVIVDNGAPPQGFTDPVNAGVRAAASPYIVIMNDDVEPLPGWWPPLRDVLDDGASVAFPATLGGPTRTDFAAWCFAVSRETVQVFGHAPDVFLDPAMRVWFQDADLLTRLRDAGRPPRLVPEARVRHGLSETVASAEPALAAWISAQTVLDRRRFEHKHPQVPVRLALL